MFEGIITAFILNLIAEIADKTQLALIALSAKHEKPKTVYFTAMAAIALATILAVLTGTLVSKLIPTHLMKIITGTLFIGFGLISMFYEEKEEKIQTGKTMSSIFLLIFLMEISGDKSNLTNLLLATQFNWIEVFIGSMLGIISIGLISVFIGIKIKEKASQEKIKLLSSIIFIIIGIILITTALIN